MTTDLTTLRVEARVLVAFGRERYEDQVTCGGVIRYLGDVGAIPAGAWGTLPVSDRLRRDWATALDHRTTEASTARNEMERIADGIMQVAAEYEQRDLDVATTFDVVNQDLGAYVAAVGGYTGAIRIRRGGVGVVGAPPYAPSGGEVVLPPGNERLNAIRHETLPTTRVVEEPLVLGSTDGNDLTISGGRSTYYDNGGGDLLDSFVLEHRDTLLQLDAVLNDLATGRRLPLSDLIVHAWRSAPEVIKNRADLIHSVANTYADVRAELDLDIKGLKLYWEGQAAAALTQYVEAASAYLVQLEAQARWLAEEGKKAGSMLEGLRNAYAAAGYQRISTLIQALVNYRERVRGPLGACSNPEKAFIEAVDSFVVVLAEAEGTYMDAMAEVIKIQEQERRERPDIGSRGHDAAPFPAREVGDNVWSDRSAWKPRPDRPSVA